LSKILYGKNIKIRQFDVDRYKHAVACLYVGNLDVDAEQVGRGIS
jgi:hypothetical protein